MEKLLPSIPAKRYFTIGEVSDLCSVKPYVLRYWEQEFTQLKPMKRLGNRRYYQHHEVLLIRRIRELLYEEGFTISGARNQLTDAGNAQIRIDSLVKHSDRDHGERSEVIEQVGEQSIQQIADAQPGITPQSFSVTQMRQELLSIRGLLVI